MKREGLIVAIGVGLLLIGILAYLRQLASPQVTLKSYSLNPAAEISLANIFAKADTDHLNIQTGERIQMAAIASNERIAGQVINAGITINQSDNARAQAIAQTTSAADQTRANGGILGTIFGFLGTLIHPPIPVPTP